jgi:DNA-binding NarL/FixJ family response regulator
MASGARILLVDDHEVFLWGLRLALSRQQWVGRCLPATNTQEAIDLAARYEPHVAVIDLNVGGFAGEDIACAVRQVRPTVRVLYLSGARRMSQRAAREAAAYGFMSKAASAPDIMRAIGMVVEGRALRDRDLPSDTALSTTVTGRERDVLRLLAEGRTNREIATVLGISPNTVKEHVRSLFRKLEARNRTQAVQFGERLGLTA